MEINPSSIELTKQKTTIKNQKQKYIHINEQIEDIESYFEEVTHQFANRKLQLIHILQKTESTIQDCASKREDRIQTTLNKLESNANRGVALSSEDIDQTKIVLSEFISKEMKYFNEIYQNQETNETELMELIKQTTSKRLLQLKGLLKKEKYEVTQGPSIVKLRNLLREKCERLQRDLTSIKESTSKCKKQGLKQVKAMLKILQEIEMQRQDRQVKQQCLMGLIDNMDTDQTTQFTSK